LQQNILEDAAVRRKRGREWRKWGIQKWERTGLTLGTSQSADKNIKRLRDLSASKQVSQHVSYINGAPAAAQ